MRAAREIQNRTGDPQRSLRNSLGPIAIITLLTLALLLAACSTGAGGNTMKLKWPGIDQHDVPVKSGNAFAVTKTFTDINNKITTAASYRVYVASYALDSSEFARSMDKPLASDDQVRVVFSLVADEGTNDKSPAKVGTYSAKADKFMKVEDVSIVSRKGGQDNKTILDRSALTGEVKVASVSGDTITGEVDLTSGETAIKGPFTAKILVRK